MITLAPGLCVVLGFALWGLIAAVSMIVWKVCWKQIWINAVVIPWVLHVSNALYPEEEHDQQEGH